METYRKKQTQKKIFTIISWSLVVPVQFTNLKLWHYQSRLVILLISMIFILKCIRRFHNNFPKKHWFILFLTKNFYYDFMRFGGSITVHKLWHYQSRLVILLISTKWHLTCSGGQSIFGMSTQKTLWANFFENNLWSCVKDFCIIFR